MNDQSNATGPRKSVGAFVAVLLLSILGVAYLKESGTIEPILAKRLIGVAFGSMMLILGNFLPKLVEPQNESEDFSAMSQAMDRFAGRVLVLFGTVFIASWILVPEPQVVLVSSLVGISGFFIIALRWSLSARSSAGNHDEIESVFHNMTVKRIVFIQMLHAILWVSLIFLADTLWGDTASRWMAIVFVLAMGLLSSYLATKARDQS
jgi:magnesium-transporting ATPase (P-type)